MAIKDPDQRRKYQRDWLRQWRRDHREEFNAYFRKKLTEYRHKYRMEILDLLGNHCVHCGNQDVRVLQIDHVNGHGYQERAQFGVSLPYYRHILKQICSGSKEYQILCANCNLIKKIEKKET